MPDPSSDTCLAQGAKEYSLIVEITAGIGVFLLSFYLAYFSFMLAKVREKKGLQRIMHTNHEPFISVVVPTYNEEDTILLKLKNLMEQDYPNMEIIVVDGSSEDKTIELTNEFVEKNGLKMSLIQEKEREGKAIALNKAFRFCSGEVVVMTDADAIWGKDTLRKALCNFSDPKVGAVTGKQVLLNPNQSLATRVESTYRSFYEVLRVGESTLDSTPIFHGELSCFKKDLIEDIREDSMADDSELAVKVRKKGFRSIYDPTAIFYEHAPPTFRSRLTQKLRRGQGLIQMFVREREVLFNSKYEEFGVLVFPAEFFMHVISPLLVLAFLASSICTLFLYVDYMLVGLAIAVGVSLLALAAPKTNKANLPLSFLNSQLILLLSLIYQMMGKSQHKWAKVNDVRRLWKKTREVHPEF